jgi:hypothetical protein
MPICEACQKPNAEDATACSSCGATLLSPTIPRWQQLALQAAPIVAGLFGMWLRTRTAPANHSKQGSPTDAMQTKAELVSEILKAQKDQEAELSKSNPDLAFQAKLNHQAHNAQLLSNMSRMSHETAMAIVKNIR